MVVSTSHKSILIEWLKVSLQAFSGDIDEVLFANNLEAF